jgi:hypothetical protein
VSKGNKQAPPPVEADHHAGDGHPASLSEHFYGNSDTSQAFNNYRPARVMDPSADHVAFSSPYPEVARVQAAGAPPTDAPTPLLAAEVQTALKNAKSLNIGTKSELGDKQPSFKISVDDQGNLTLEKLSDPKPGEELTIEVDAGKDGDNKSLADAIKQAHKNLQEYVREMLTKWHQDHPNDPNHPTWWDDVLASTPAIPDNPQPVQPVSRPRPTPQPDVQPTRTSSGGGGGGGGGGYMPRGDHGFDQNGNFQPGSSDQPIFDTGGGGTAQDLSGGQKVAATDIYNYLTKEYGLRPEIASGILGNMQVESGFRTNANNPSEGAIGLCQWEGGRRKELEAFANRPEERAKAQADGVSNPVLDWKVQVDFMMHELKGDNGQGGSEANAWRMLQQARTPEQAAAAFDQYYERSSGAARGTRVADARQIHDQVANA